MTHKILLTNSDKFFEAEFTKEQPTEAIILFCLRRFKLKIPDDHSRCLLYAKGKVKDTMIPIHCEDTSKRWGFYKIPDDAELYFNPEPFKKEAEYWVDYFHLGNWQIYFEHTDVEEVRARCWVNFVGMTSTIELTTHWNEPPEKNDIKRSAFHEVCELLLRELSSAAEDFYAKPFIDQKTHDIIRRLENGVFK